MHSKCLLCEACVSILTIKKLKTQGRKTCSEDQEVADGGSDPRTSHSNSKSCCHHIIIQCFHVVRNSSLGPRWNLLLGRLSASTINNNTFCLAELNNSNEEN